MQKIKENKRFKEKNKQLKEEGGKNKKMERNRTKFFEENGITLIALIVTIIVLLILAGVSISVLTGDNGILEQAVNAKEQSGQDSVLEQVKLAILSARTAGNGEIDTDELQSELSSISGYIGNASSLPADIEVDGYHFVIAEDGTVSVATWYLAYDDDGVLSGVTDGTTTLEIGDTIDYDATTASATYTSSSSRSGYSKDQKFSSTSYTGEWAILGASGGKILIMPTSNIQTTSNVNYYLQGQAGYQYAESELDNICAIYGNGTGASGARSVKVEDLNKITGYNPNNVGVYDPNQTGTDGTPYGSGTIYQYGNDVTYTWSSTTNKVDYLGSNGKSGTGSAYTGYATYGFNWFDTLTKSWKSSTQVAGEEICTLTSTAYHYCPDTLLDDNIYDVVGFASGSGVYDLIFSNCSSSDDEYWLSSTYGYTSTFGCIWSVGAVMSCGGVDFQNMYTSFGTIDGGGRGVRPVVTLESDISITKDGSNAWTIN